MAVVCSARNKAAEVTDDAALHAAAAAGDAAIVQQLLSAGAAANAQDQRWDTPLHAAGKPVVSP